MEYAEGDAFLFGPESCGLPAEILRSVHEQQRIRLPMKPASRSLNLSNTVAVLVYEAWRHIEFGMVCNDVPRGSLFRTRPGRDESRG